MHDSIMFVTFGIGSLMWIRKRRASARLCKVVALGTTNPGKREACVMCFLEWCGGSVLYQVMGVRTDSGVPDQPMGLEQTIAGARYSNVMLI